MFRALFKGQAKLMTVVQPPGVQWVVNSLQIQLEYACNIFTIRIQPQEINLIFLQSSCGMTYRVIKHMQMTILIHQARTI
jgi:hypothetical protein